MENALRTYQNAVCVVTGGASGIGAALGAELTRRGAHLVVVDRQSDLAGEVVAKLVSEGGSAEAAVLDVRDAAAVETVIENVFEHHGRLDYLFNNAGVLVTGPALEQTLEDWRYIIDVNLMGVVHGVQAAYPRMCQQGFGHIVNTASAAGLMPAPIMASYSTTKFAIVGLSRTLRIEARLQGVRVSALCPGVIETPLLLDAGRFGRMTRAVPAEIQHEMTKPLRPMPLDRFAPRVLDHVAKNQAIIIEPKWWRRLWWLERYARGVGDWLSYRNYLRARAHLERADEAQSDPS